MAALSAQQIAKYAYDAGFRGEALTIAVAIALAESGGNAGARNPKGEDSRGLWQINVAPDVRPNKWGDLYDPAVNARAAFEVSGGGKNFQPWTTYAHSTAHGRAASYTKHLDTAKAATANMGGTGVMGTLAQGAPKATTSSPGAGPATAPQTTLPPNASQADIEAFVQENYPGAAYLLRADDATRMLVVHAAQQGWSADRLKGAIEKTDWYRKTSETERQWRETVDTDPASADVRRAQQQALISDQAARLGAILQPDQMAMVVEGSLRFGWTQQQIIDTLAGFTSTKKPVGDARTILQNLRATAADFAVPVDRKTLDFWTDKILRGEQDEDDFVGYLRGQAIGLFKGNDAAIKQIESGFTVRQIAAGSLGYAARELDVADTSTLDLMDPKWLRLVHHFDPETKTFRPMSAAEVQKTVRTDPTYGFDQTSNARGLAARLRGGLEELFGISA